MERLLRLLWLLRLLRLLRLLWLLWHRCRTDSELRLSGFTRARSLVPRSLCQMLLSRLEAGNGRAWT